MTELTDAQKSLKQKHGTPEAFAEACNLAAATTTADCEAAIEKYRREWAEAGTIKREPMPKIQIVCENFGGNYSPVLATFDKAKAKAKYLELIKAANRKVATSVGMAKVDDNGVERGATGTSHEVDVIRIDGEWYELHDTYGDVAAEWFEQEVE